MAKKDTGFSLERPARDERPSRGRVVAQALDEAGRSIVRLDEVALNPVNPNWRNEAVGEAFEQLVASVREIGVLSPPVVVSISAWRAAHPGQTVPAEMQWVVMDGNRRVLAAREAGLQTLEVTANDALAARDLDVIAHSDVRAGLTPIDEARLYRDMLATPKPDGARRTQSDLAAALGISQSAVAKRVKLLELPQVIQQWIADDLLPHTKAAELLAQYEPADLAVATASLPERPRDALRAIQRAAQETRRERLTEAAREQAQQIAARDGITYMAEAGSLSSQLILLGADPEDTPRPELLVTASTTTPGSIVYYRQPEQSSGEGGDAPVLQELSDRQLERQARDARWPYALQLATAKPSAGELRAVLVRMMLSNQSCHADEERTAWKIAIDLGQVSAVDEIGRAAKDAGRWEYLKQLASDPTDERAAWLKIVAWHETQLVWRDNLTVQAWAHPETRWYYSQLQSLGYTPTSWETTQLTTQETAE